MVPHIANGLKFAEGYPKAFNDIFLFVEKSKICNFADGSTAYLCGKDLSKIKEDLIRTIKTY